MERTPDELVKIIEIRSHVKRCFKYYGESDSYFEEYMNELLRHPTEKVLICFRDMKCYG